MPGGDWLAGYGWQVGLAMQDFGIRLSTTALCAVLSLVFESVRERASDVQLQAYLAAQLHIFKLNNSHPRPIFRLSPFILPTKKRNSIMSIAAPIITFKAGICDLDVRINKLPASHPHELVKTNTDCCCSLDVRQPSPS